MSERLYSVATWDNGLQAYTPQAGLSVPSANVPLWALKRVLKELRRRGYGAHRYRSSDGSHGFNDWTVLIKRTDGQRMDGQR